MTPRVLWTPSNDASNSTAMGRFATLASGWTGRDLSSYNHLWDWSVSDLSGFWAAIVDFFGVELQGSTAPVFTGDTMIDTRWFPGATLNYASHILSDRFEGDSIAIIAESQLWGNTQLTRTELRRQVARFQAALLGAGLKKGDAVAAFMPNIAETVVAFMACAGLGITWSSCAPEFGVKAVVDRLGQFRPKVLLAVERYRHGTKVIDRTGDLAQIVAQLPSVETTVVLGDPEGPLTNRSTEWNEFLGEDPGRSGPHAPNLCFEPVPFDHPLYVLFSSGTTGLPKPIIHGHGGILLEHLKTLGLHSDLGPGDRFFWYSTTGWMMWNLLVSALGVGATVVCYDGDPTKPDPSTLWSLAERTRTTYFGASAGYLMNERARGARPAEDFDLDSIRTIGSTGSPLPPAGFDWVAEQFGQGVQVASISGGTDVCSAFVGAAPLVPVWEGEISCRYLGAKVESFSPSGEALIGEQGELVVTAPMPSMPVALLGDDDRSRLRSSYYSRFEGVWAHGDWVTITERGSLIITGRSDATLNRGGVRLGTAEFYGVVETMPTVSDSLVVHLEDDQGGQGKLLLFVVPKQGQRIDDSTVASIKSRIRQELSPRHVPDEVVVIGDVPRTLSGKKLEVPVKAILQGADPEAVISVDSLANPESLRQFADRAGSEQR